jgi:mRNA interferase RelE/StbE
MTYHVEFTKQAAKQFKAVPSQEQQRMKPRIDALSVDPRPNGVTKLAGEENIYRIRVGNYRVIYNIQDHQLLVLVVKIGHRRNVYQ